MPTQKPPFIRSLGEPAHLELIQGGRAMQRVWLALEAENLAMCPLGSLPIFVGHMEQLGGRETTR